MKARSYGDHEFCKSVNCIFLIQSGQFADQYTCERKERGTNCTKSAKEFHKWLNANGFFILKLEVDGEKPIS